MPENVRRSAKALLPRFDFPGFRELHKAVLSSAVWKGNMNMLKTENLKNGMPLQEDALLKLKESL